MVVGVELEEASEELEGVGSTMMSGNPLEGVLEVVGSSVVACARVGSSSLAGGLLFGVAFELDSGLACLVFFELQHRTV